MANKKYFSLTLILCSILLFLMGYLIWNDVKYENEEVKRQNLSIDVNVIKVDNKEYLNKIVEENCKILFEIQSNGDKFIVERIRTAEEEEVVGKTGTEVEKKYNHLGYTLKSVKSNEIELERKSLVYNPNRYILFTENNEIVIVKSDEKGNIFGKDGKLLNKEGTGTKCTSLRQNDIQNIIKGDEVIQFESIEQLNDGIKDFDIKYEMPE